MDQTQIVAGLFQAGASFPKALAEFHWSLAQNPEFWRQAVLYCDRDTWPHVEPVAHRFREVIPDHELPPHVDRQRKWACKAWWPVRALERFPRILYCDFDILVRRLPDTGLEARLVSGPMFLYMPNYASAQKGVGCGVVFYDRATDMRRFADLVYSKWNCDERAWTEALSMTREKLLASDRHLNPWIVDYTWLLKHPAERGNPYLVHGISSVDDGYNRLLRIGYAPSEIGFHQTGGQRLRSFAMRLLSRIRRSP